MRALYPDRYGFVDRDGVRIFYEEYGGDHRPSVVLIPASPITHARSWKAQIAYLARHYRVVTMDGRGNGRSDQPRMPEEHTRQANVGDILAVLNATDTEEAVVVAHCHANWWAVELSSTQPTRVQALVSVAPGVPYLGGGHEHWKTASATFDEVLDEPTGWQLFNRHIILNEQRRWLEFFFSQQLPEPHSTKQHEDMVSWGLESSGEVLVAGELGPEIDVPDQATFERVCRDLQIPVLVIHGDMDPCQPVERGRAFAEITGGDLVIINGAGHLAPAREPVKVNLAIRHFVERVAA